ncbi:MAG: hypothetical protein VX527_02690 [Planctomycetota bacterium]|nr:hypothetical protein [Planctomycetota bacterium]
MARNTASRWLKYPNLWGEDGPEVLMDQPDRSIQSDAGVEAHWRALPGLLGGIAGLAALVLAIAAGLWADNDATTILVRGLVAMGICWLGGYIAGWVVKRAVHADAKSDCDEDLGLTAVSDDSHQAEESVSEAREQREAA